MSHLDHNSAVRFLVPMSVQPRKPLFVFLPGMDGSGTLLHTQLAALEPWFDLRCLAIPPEDDAGWTRLTQQVIQLIRAEVSQTESPAVVTHSGQNLEPPKSWVKRPLKRDQLKKGQLKRGRQVTGSNKTIRRSVSRRSVYLCGESFGGCLAMHVLIRAPELFDRVILVNPASSFRRLPWMQLGQMITQRLPSSVYRYGALGLVPFLIDPFRVRQQDRKALEKAMDAVPPKTAAWRMSLLSEFEAERLPLERMTHPVLLIAGGRDRLLPSKREVQDLHRRFPHAQQHLLPNSGHACLLEKDVNLYQILRQCDFLESHIGA